MSSWSNIIALVQIASKIPGYPFPFRDAVEMAIDTAPRIYGSEGNAIVKVIDWGFANDIEPEHRHLWQAQIYPWLICSCCAYEYKCKHKGKREQHPRTACKGSKQRRKAHKTDGYNGCLHPISSYAGCMVYVHGNLRDTTPEQTRAEFKRLVQYIKNSFPESGCPLEAKVVFSKIN